MKQIKIFLAFVMGTLLITSVKSINKENKTDLIMKEPTMSINIGISPEHQKEIIRILNIILADEFIIYTKILNFHWNVVGSDFAEYHKFLNDLYEKQLDVVDDVAERVRTLGGIALGSCADFIEYARLQEHTGPVLSALHMMQALTDDQETLVKNLRKDLEVIGKNYHDAGTENFLTDLMEKHEKFAWMLRSFNQK